MPTQELSAYVNGLPTATLVGTEELYLDIDKKVTVNALKTFVDVNFANTDLTLTANRTHGLNEFTLGLLNGDVVFTNKAAGSATAVSITNNNGANIALELTSGHLKLTGIATYADEAAAVIGGLATGVVYKTATGELRIKL